MDRLTVPSLSLILSLPCSISPVSHSTSVSLCLPLFREHSLFCLFLSKCPLVCLSAYQSVPPISSFLSSFPPTIKLRERPQPTKRPQSTYFNVASQSSRKTDATSMTFFLLPEQQLKREAWVKGEWKGGGRELGEAGGRGEKKTSLWGLVLSAKAADGAGGHFCGWLAL